MLKILKKTKQKPFNKSIFGFDIETCNDNKNFVLASIYSNNYQKFFYSIEELKHELLTNLIFRDSYIFATNLSFDFFGTFFKEPNFFTLFRGSDLLLAQTFFYNDKFHNKSNENDNTLASLTFLDSLNFAKLSVEKMGKIINKPKLEHPSFLGEMPKNETEWEIMRKYNLMDSIITFEFMTFLIESFEHLGATFKNTLASTSMALFKNKYLEGQFMLQDEDVLLEQFSSYYGGRTEAFKRGKIENMYYYDFNSLYPAVMRDNMFPDPNSLRITKENTLDYIKAYDGISLVDVHVLPSRHPLLPFRTSEGRVIFPTGHFRGWYTHIELREGLKNGTIILKVHKTHYFTEMCKPFEKFMNDLYNLRNEYKKTNNPMEYVVKITMNSLYGKFGQRFLGRENVIHQSMLNYDDLDKYEHIERVGDYVRLVEDGKPSSFCIPIWASYVTAYGRIKLFKVIKECDPVYCDTDSVITDMPMKTSDKLGDLKLEMNVKEGIIVRPKFYALKTETEDLIKIKGLGKRLMFAEFLGLLKDPFIEYEKFTKFKEALRRDFIPNEIIKVHKEFSLEDEKRKWKDEFNPKVMENSSPRFIS